MTCPRSLSHEVGGLEPQPACLPNLSPHSGQWVPLGLHFPTGGEQAVWVILTGERHVTTTPLVCLIETETLVSASLGPSQVLAFLSLL